MKAIRIASLAVALLALPAAAQEEKKAAAPPAGPSQEEIMKMWQEVATPGAPHELLAKSAGSWTAKVKSWMEPGKPAEESEGTTESKMVLGGRFLEEHMSGTMMGQPFEGIGYSGYDNYKKKYVATWMDNMGTTILSMSGKLDKSGKKLTMSGVMDDFVTKKLATYTSVTTFVDDDHHTFAMFMPGPDGKPFKSLEINYTRKKD